MTLIVYIFLLGFYIFLHCFQRRILVQETVIWIPAVDGSPSTHCFLFTVAATSHGKKLNEKAADHMSTGLCCLDLKVSSSSWTSSCVFFCLWSGHSLSLRTWTLVHTHVPSTQDIEAWRIRISKSSSATLGVEASLNYMRLFQTQKRKQKNKEEKKENCSLGQSSYY